MYTTLFCCVLFIHVTFIKAMINFFVDNFVSIEPNRPFPVGSGA